MKIIVLTDNYSITSATALAHLLSREDLSIVAVLIKDRSNKDKNTFKTLFDKYKKKQGYRYVINKGRFILYVKLRIIFSRIIRILDKKIYYSLEEVKEKYPFKEITIKDINSNDSFELLKSFDFDVLLSLSYPQIIRNNRIFDLAEVGNINLHRSLLPKHRGSNPVFWARAHQEIQTGITFHHIEPTVDTGNIINQRKIHINSKKDSHIKVLRKMSQEIPVALDELFKSNMKDLNIGMSQKKDNEIPNKAPTKFDRKKHNIWD
ncbi:MAG: formyltransferase family protein [bacterium]